MAKAKKNLHKKSPQLSRDEWINAISHILYESSPELCISYSDVRPLSTVLDALGEQNLITLPEGSMAEFVRQAILRPLKVKVRYVRSACTRSDVSDSVRGILSYIKRWGISPALVGATLEDLEAFERIGHAASARRTIAGARKAVKKGVMNGHLFTVFCNLPMHVEKSDRSITDFGFASFSEYGDFLKECALPYLQKCVTDRPDKTYFSSYFSVLLDRFGITEDELGVTLAELRSREVKRLAQFEAAQAESRAGVEAQNYRARRRQETKNQLVSLLAEIRAGKPQPREPWKKLSDDLAQNNLRPEDVGSSLEEIAQLEKQRGVLHGSYLANGYREGWVAPRYLFEQLTKLGVHPALVGVSELERALFTEK